MLTNDGDYRVERSMIRYAMLLAAWVFTAATNTALADTFTATYRELVPSPQNVIMTWYSDAVTRDGKFVHVGTLN